MLRYSVQMHCNSTSDAPLRRSDTMLQRSDAVLHRSDAMLHRSDTLLQCVSGLLIATFQSISRTVYTRSALI